MQIKKVLILNIWDFDFEKKEFKNLSVGLLNAVDRIEYDNGDTYIILLDYKINVFSTQEKFEAKMKELRLMN